MWTFTVPGRDGSRNGTATRSAGTSSANAAAPIMTAQPRIPTICLSFFIKFTYPILQPFHPSTPQPFNPSTLQPFNPSTLQPFNPSTLQPFNPSTLQPFNPSTLQPFN